MPRSRHGTFSTKLRIPFNIFAMAEVAMDVPNIRYYIEKLQILMYFCCNRKPIYDFLLVINVLHSGLKLGWDDFQFPSQRYNYLRNGAR